MELSESELLVLIRHISWIVFSGFDDAWKVNRIKRAIREAEEKL